jgi:hypothetical protein
MSNKKETVEQIYKLLLALIDDNTKKESVIEESIETKPKKTRKTKPKKQQETFNVTDREQKSKFTNKFDSMPERNMFKDDVEIDRKLRVMEPCPRTRSFHTIEVTCRVCGKKDNINPVLANETTRYKCNTCARSGG